MIPQKHRQWMTLAGLLLVLVVVVLYQGGSQDPPAAPATAPSNPVGRTASAPRRDVPVTDVKLDVLERTRESARETDRNPFRFRPTPPPPPPRAVERTPPQVALAPPVPAGPPPPPPIPLRFIGVIDAQPRVGILSDGRGNVFYGKDGDIIDGRYRVLRIGADSADLSYTDGRGRQTLRLSGQ